MEINRNELIALRTGQKLPQRSGEYWDEKELEKLLSFFVEGYGISELAVLFGRTEIAIYQQLGRLGLLAPQCRPRSRRTKSVDIPQCSCPTCAVTDCKNCGKEGPHA